MTGEAQTGPMQLLVLGFEGGEMKGEALAELVRLAERDIVRLVDALVVRKHEDGSVELLEIAQPLGGGGEPGVLVGRLTGLTAEADADDASGALAAEQLGDVVDDDVWYVADAIPPGTAAAVALLEHRWAIPLRAALQGAGGQLLDEAWVHPLDLQAVGIGGG